MYKDMPLRSRLGFQPGWIKVLMNYNDFRYMRRGKQNLDLKKEDFSLLEPVDQRGPKKDRALLLIHGFSSSPAVYRYLIPQLKNYDALVCPALPGHAESIEAFSRAKSSQWLAYASQACEALCQEYQKVDVLGLSLGGLLACELSHQFKLNRLFLLAPCLKLRMNLNLNIKLLQVLQALRFRELRCKGGNIVTNQSMEISYRKLSISTIIELFTMIQAYQWIAPTTPVDLFLGSDDAVVASEEVEELFMDLPNVTIHWLANSAHVLPLDNDLDQIVQCVNQRME